METQPTIIITGGSGYIGSSIIELLSSNFKIYNLDNSAPKQSSGLVVHKHFDITSEESVEAALRQIKEEAGDEIYSVVHLAGYYNFDGRESSLYEEVNVRGTQRLLTKLREGFKVGQFIFSSSMLIYAPSKPGQKISEDSPIDPGWAYPRSKVDCERIIRELHGDIPIVLLRIAAVYNDTGYAPSITQQILRLHELQFTSFLLPGNKNHVQSGIHVNDLAEVMRLLVEKRDQLPNELALSASEDRTPSYGTIHKMIAALDHKRALPLFRIPKFIARFGSHVLPLLPASRKSFIKSWMIRYADANYDLDNTRIKSVLGWQPKHDLESTLPVIIRNLKMNPGRWYRANKISLPTVPAILRTQMMKRLGGES